MGEQFVIDASAFVQGFIEDADTNRVLTLIQSLFDPDPIELHTPEFCLLECTNILWKQVRFHGMAVSDMQRALGNLTSTPLIIHPAPIFLPRAAAIGVEHELAIYDSIYIAMCESLGYPLITVDVKQAKVASALGIKLKPLSDFPEFKP